MSGNMDGYVYFVGCPAMDAVKIGFTSSNPRKRMSALQTGCPFKLELLLVVDGDREWEQSIHGYCAGDGLEGEWFTLSGKAGEIMSALASFYQKVDGTNGSVRWQQ